MARCKDTAKHTSQRSQRRANQPLAMRCIWTALFTSLVFLVGFRAAFHTHTHTTIRGFAARGGVVLVITRQALH